MFTNLFYPKNVFQNGRHFIEPPFLIANSKSWHFHYHVCGRRGGLMGSVRLLIGRSWFKPWSGTLCCVLGQDTLFSQFLSPPRCINGYKWQWTSIPSRGNSNTTTLLFHSSRFMLLKPGIGADLMGHSFSEGLHGL